MEISTSTYPTDDITDPVEFRHLRSLWLGLHISGGHVGLSITVLTFLIARRVSFNSNFRHLTLINFCVTWIVYSVVYCLTLYERPSYEEIDSEDPSPTCYLQAALTHGAAPMSAVAGLLVVIQLLCAQRQHSLSSLTRWRWVNNSLILVPPYFTFAAFASMTTFVILREKAPIVYTNGFYCTFEDQTTPILAVPAFCAVMMTAIIVVEAIIWVNWLRWRNRVRTLCPLLESHSFTTSLAIRAAVFTIYCLVVLGACLVFLTNDFADLRTPFPYMVQASIPLVAFLVFATQEDTLRIWLSPFVRKDRGHTQLPSRQNSCGTDIPSARVNKGLRVSAISAFTTLSGEIPPKSASDARGCEDREKGLTLHGYVVNEPGAV